VQSGSTFEAGNRISSSQPNDPRRAFGEVGLSSNSQ
jgi:hypothetical protein